ncbi:MAG TPA: fumarylacetoacetate hydrolase family protein [Polyangia bacterium]
MVKTYCRFKHGGSVAFGVVEGASIHQLAGNPLQTTALTGATVPLSQVTLLAPFLPQKILAVGQNYRSHVGMKKLPSRPEIFYKPITALQDPGGPIVLPADSTRVHLEGELVLVIGKTTRHAPVERARAAIFGVTCGNDISERDWQSGPDKDLQWWRAKGADTFAPCGPYVVSGLDDSDLLLQTRLNGETVQRETTGDMIFDAATIVSFISRYVTLEPGDLIYSGTPGNTVQLSPGDVVEVDIQGVGVLRNPVVAS